MPEQLENMVSGRRSFDRQFELLSIGVHTLQRDFAALEERAKATQKALEEMGDSFQRLSDKLHAMDKVMVAKIATITVTERVLWALGSAMLGTLIHFF